MAGSRAPVTPLWEPLDCLEFTKGGPDRGKEFTSSRLTNSNPANRSKQIKFSETATQ